MNSIPCWKSTLPLARANMENVFVISSPASVLLRQVCVTAIRLGW